MSSGLDNIAAPGPLKPIPQICPNVQAKVAIQLAFPLCIQTFCSAIVGQVPIETSNTVKPLSKLAIQCTGFPDELWRCAQVRWARTIIGG